MDEVERVWLVGRTIRQTFEELGLEVPDMEIVLSSEDDCFVRVKDNPAKKHAVEILLQMNVSVEGENHYSPML